jgi:hypothetical protein
LLRDGKSYLFDGGVFGEGGVFGDLILFSLFSLVDRRAGVFNRSDFILTFYKSSLKCYKKKSVTK